MDLLDRVPPTADHRIAYGPDASQFGDLWIPKGVKAPLPVVVMIHGGWWLSAFGLGYCGHLCAALRKEGFAVWSIEYRRLGATGGGWPATFLDVTTGFGHLSELAGPFRLDLGRVLVAGHSAGGHLAFFLAGQYHVPAGVFVVKPPVDVPIRGVVGLAAVVDLRLAIETVTGPTYSHVRPEITRFMGGSPDAVPDRYLAGDPGFLLPLGVPQVLLQGTEDAQIPPTLPQRWAAKARQQGDRVAVVTIPHADHFDVVDPESAAWPMVRGAFQHLL